MVPAAALTPNAHVAIERVLVTERRRLRAQVQEYVQWLRGAGREASASEMQRRFALIRMSFNDVLSQFDLFSDAITQRSEHETGVWLSGLDVFAEDALELEGDYFEAPPLICYLDRGPGAAIRRARTRLPGGVKNPVSIIRVPRERMVGYGIASSLVHEVGHQGAALLDLIPSLRPVLLQRETTAPEGERLAWRVWGRWISEIVADFWSVGKLGIGSTLGLMGVVSLPRYFVFAVQPEDPHPMPYVRVRLSCAVGNALYPHPQWNELAGLWADLYPTSDLDPSRRNLITLLERTMPAFVELLADHRPAALQGRSLREVMPVDERHPARLMALDHAWEHEVGRMRDESPTLVFAVLGQARAQGTLNPEIEIGVVRKLLTHWALRSTLELMEACAEESGPAEPGLNGRVAAAPRRAT
jgi:hypothetical protein